MIRLLLQFIYAVGDLWQLLKVAFFAVPAGYFLYTGATAPELDALSGGILAALWLWFAGIVSSLFNVVCKLENWANRD